MKQYLMNQRIGQGSFGQVFLAFHPQTGEKFALKLLKCHFSSERQLNQLLEIKILKKLSHPNIISLVDTQYNANNYKGSLILQHCQSDLLRTYCSLKKRPFQLTIKKTLYQIALVNYIHCDLKPQNILLKGLGQNQIVKIYDFGVSRIYKKQPLTFYFGSRCYRAPELLINNRNYNRKIDVFSLGCIMAEIYNQQILFQGENQLDQLLLILKKLGTPTIISYPQFSNWCILKGIICEKYKKSLDSIIFRAKSTDLSQDLVQRMLKMNPKTRISAAQILNHPYFDQIKNSVLFKPLTNQQTNYQQKKSQRKKLKSIQNHQLLTGQNNMIKNERYNRKNNSYLNSCHKKSLKTDNQFQLRLKEVKICTTRRQNHKHYISLKKKSLTISQFIKSKSPYSIRKNPNKKISQK